ncbi:nucleotide-binding alpha-beta plait domain-containing protein [Tanacetum coccineum]|uniref:Nucleotide-binding alpha-beta plait domain-containing protein n=1 Tax=Tanacetum coccineum TaxID=301880 RepID=A0ABQ5DWY4_9ASTR
MLSVSGLREEYNSLKTAITARQSPTAFSELHALLSDHDYMLGKTRAPAPYITSSFAANYAVGSPSMPESRQAQLSELTAQLSGSLQSFRKSCYRPPTTIIEPTSFTVANNSPEWNQAMKDGTWSLVPRASNTNVVDEAKYKALADTVTELTWLQALFNELGIRSSSTLILWCDNLGATYLSANPIFHARTKHVEIDYHFVREKGNGYSRKGRKTKPKTTKLSTEWKSVKRQSQIEVKDNSVKVKINPEKLKVKKR